jgi:hypothetical protein
MKIWEELEIYSAIMLLKGNKNKTAAVLCRFSLNCMILFFDRSRKLHVACRVRF